MSDENYRYLYPGVIFDICFQEDNHGGMNFFSKRKLLGISMTEIWLVHCNIVLNLYIDVIYDYPKIDKIKFTFPKLE